MMKLKKKIKKISYKITALILVVSIFICGCTPVKNHGDNINDEKISFTGLDDSQLQDYVIEHLYSGVNAEFTNDDYTIEEISTVYISKEYIEESEYNAKSNIYFGYTLDEIEKRADFIKELGIPTTLREIGATEEMLPLIANSTEIMDSGYKKLTADEILEILKEAY